VKGVGGFVRVPADIGEGQKPLGMTKAWAITLVCEEYSPLRAGGSISISKGKSVSTARSRLMGS
jgi:hypothetical protein